jgi:hypothetical protein
MNFEIELTSSAVIADHPFKETEIPGVLLNVEDNTVLLAGPDTAILIKTAC